MHYLYRAVAVFLAFAVGAPPAFGLRVQAGLEGSTESNLATTLREDSTARLASERSQGRQAGLESGSAASPGRFRARLWAWWLRAWAGWRTYGLWDNFRYAIWKKGLKATAEARDLSKKARRLRDRLVERKMPTHYLTLLLRGGIPRAIDRLDPEEVVMRLEQLERWLREPAQGPTDPVALRLLLEGVLTYPKPLEQDPLERGVELMENLSRNPKIKGWIRMEDGEIHSLLDKVLAFRGPYRVQVSPAVERIERSETSTQSSRVLDRKEEISLVPLGDFQQPGQPTPPLRQLGSSGTDGEKVDSAGLEGVRAQARELLRRLPHSDTLHVLDPALVDSESPYRGVVVLAGLEDAVLIGSPDVTETVLQLIEREAREVFVYGFAPWVARFKAAAEAALIRVHPYLPGQVPWPGFLRRLLANLSGLPSEAVSDRVPLGRLATLLDRLA